MLRQLSGGGGDRVSNGFCTVPGQRRTVLGPGRVTVACQARKVQKHRKPGGALDECPDRGAIEPQDEIALPVTRDSAILDLGRAFTDHDLRSDELLAARSGSLPRHAQRSSGAKTRRQFAAESTTTLHVEGLVGRFMCD